MTFVNDDGSSAPRILPGENAIFAELTRQLAEAQAEIERLTISEDVSRASIATLKRTYNQLFDSMQREQESRRKAEAELAALKAAMVKPLEWSYERITDDGAVAQDANSSIGLYTATTEGWFLQGRTGWKRARSRDEAKAAAQADYADRILSALTLPPEEQEG